jgi:CubicO group peptidase (beta-lactamase class C family)
MIRSILYLIFFALTGSVVVVPTMSLAQEVYLIPSYSVGTAPVLAGCPTFAQRIVFTGVTDTNLSEERSTLESRFMRAISISAATDPDTGEPVFDIVAARDQYGTPLTWGMSAGLSRADVLSMMTILPGRLSSIDAYLGEENERRYAITWVNDGLTSEFSVGVTLDELRDDEEMNRVAGLRPIWIDGFHDEQTTRYSAIWVDDGVSGEMDLDALNFDAADAAWKARTDQGLRMLRMTQFEVNAGEGETESRRMSVWQEDNSNCFGHQWSTFTDDGPVAFRATLIAQNMSAASHTIEERAITVDLDDLPGMLFVAAGDGEGNENSVLKSIIPMGIPDDGTIVILALGNPEQPFTIEDTHWPTYEPEDPPEGFEELIEGHNIRLRRWNVGAGIPDADVDNDEACITNAPLSGCSGQVMRMRQFHDRIVLAWDAENEVWREVKRDGLLPDPYEPIATDSHFSGSARWISSTWIGPDRRIGTSRVLEPANTTETPSVSYSNLLSAVDTAILGHMRARRIPYATFAIADGGRVIDARSFSVVPENFFADPRIAPDTAFRIASISKPVTALAIMRLVDAGALDLDMPITDIPGVNDLIGTDWANIDMVEVTTRMLLYHLGGWDRGLHGEISFGRDFEICGADGQGLPITMERMLAFARNEPVRWLPGVKHTYSNFGFTLLGRVIEAVSGQSYADFVQNNVLTPEVAAGFEMAASSGPWLADNPGNVIEGYDVRSLLAFSIWGTPPLGSHPLRDGCNRDHADWLPLVTGFYNTGLMDAHGGWIADAPSVARLFSQMPDMMSASAFETLSSRPTGRELRIIQENETGAPLDHTYQLVRGRHPAGSPGLDLSAIPAGTRLFIGLGLNTFSSIDIDLSAAATSGLSVTALYSGAFNALLALEIDDDGTEGLTQNGAITFTPPMDWMPQARNGETQPRFWIALQFGAIPAISTAPVFDKINVVGLVDRGLAFTTSPQSWTLDVTDFVSPGGSFEIVGAQSQASADVIAFTNSAGNSTFTLLDKGEGSFIPGERLGIVGPNDPAFAQIARVGADRERPLSVSLEHGGVLPGVETHAVRRSDGVSWALFLAQGAATTPFYIARGVGALEDGIDNLMDAVPAGDWPGWDIAPME